MINPYGSIDAYLDASSSGRIPIRIRDPSSGGMGIRLNIPNTTLITANWPKSIFRINGRGTTLISTAIAIARRIFEAGPLAPTRTISLRGFLNAQKLIGTGLAAPNTNLPPVEINRTSGRIIVPNRSICAIGFNVNLPENFAVVSPSLYAVQPCANSCIVMATINRPKDTKSEIMFNQEPRFYVFRLFVLCCFFAFG